MKSEVRQKRNQGNKIEIAAQPTFGLDEAENEDHRRPVHLSPNSRSFDRSQPETRKVEKQRMQVIRSLNNSGG